MAVVDRLLEYLLLFSSGWEPVERGFVREVELSAELDTSDSIPVLQGEAFVGFSTNKRLPSTDVAPNGL
jgi:hypothetical protein